MARRGQAAPARGGRLEKKIEKRGINGASFMVVVVMAGESSGGEAPARDRPGWSKKGPREGVARKLYGYRRRDLRKGPAPSRDGPRELPGSSRYGVE